MSPPLLSEPKLDVVETFRSVKRTYYNLLYHTLVSLVSNLRRNSSVSRVLLGLVTHNKFIALNAFHPIIVAYWDIYSPY